MGNIEVGEAQAYVETTKLPITVLDVELEQSVSSQVLAKLAAVFDTSTWISPSSTPKLVRNIISMQYVSWQISRAYAGDETASDYAIRLLAMSEALIAGLVAGSIGLPDLPEDQVPFEDAPAFYPTDASSLLEPTADDRSLGGPAFTMGVIW